MVQLKDGFGTTIRTWAGYLQDVATAVRTIRHVYCERQQELRLGNLADESATNGEKLLNQFPKSVTVADIGTHDSLAKQVGTNGRSRWIFYALPFNFSCRGLLRETCNKPLPSGGCWCTGARPGRSKHHHYTFTFPHCTNMAKTKSALLSPSHAMQYSQPWYKRPLSSDPDDPEDNEFDFMAGASTPLKVNHTKSIMFLSPMRKLDNLHLNSEFASSSFKEDDEETEDTQKPSLRPHAEAGEEENYDSDGYGPGDNTIIHESSEDDNDESELLGTAPVYVRKRKHSETPLAMEITPNANFSIPQGSSGKNLSAYLAHLTSDSIGKISFSASDSTPCPTQPRKRPKFKGDDETPSQPSKMHRPILDLSSSRKVASSTAALMSKLNDAHDDMSEDDETPLTYMSGQTTTNQQSTPISQSTPANSRAPSPGLSFEESEHDVGGYRFVRPAHGLKYQTPLSRPTSEYPVQNAESLRASYHSGSLSLGGAYKIVGEFPVSAAGLMDEDDESLHVADRRINDPYAASPPAVNPAREKESAKLREMYLALPDKLPLLAHFQRALSEAEMLRYIGDGKSVLGFYREVIDTTVDSEYGFLKKERLRWHPDKWVGKLEASPFTKDVIDRLSQVINGIIEEL